MSFPNSIFLNNILNNKRALITGGGSGIGYEIARQLGLHGCHVTIMGRREKFLIDACNEMKKDQILCNYVTGDVRNENDANNAIEYAYNNQSLDILVNAAAGNFLANAGELSLKGFRTVIEIDTIGCFNMCRAAFNKMKLSTNDSLIVNISATLQYGATWYQSHASAAKAAIDSLTRSLALEWGEFNIRVVGIAPGPIGGTPGMTKLAPGVEQEDIEDMVKEFIPIGRMGMTWDIGQMVVYLSSRSGTFITGDTIVVDGGQWMYKQPMLPREMVSEISRSVEKKSRSMGPKSRL